MPGGTAMVVPLYRPQVPWMKGEGSVRMASTVLKDLLLLFHALMEATVTSLGLVSLVDLVHLDTFVQLDLILLHL